jgi:dihydroneopterin aldolase
MTLEPGGWLCIEGIEVQCTIGVTERERAAKQCIVISLKLKVDFGKVAVSDAIAAASTIGSLPSACSPSAKNRVFS